MSDTKRPEQTSAQATIDALKKAGGEAVDEYKKYSDSPSARYSRIQTTKQVGQAIGAAAAGGAGIAGSLSAGAGVITAKVAAVVAFGAAAAPVVGAAALVGLAGAGIYGAIKWLDKKDSKDV
jgi:hypothetical protein